MLPGESLMTRILLIDDDPALLDVLSMALEDAGFDVVTAEDGLAGLAEVARTEPAVVVSDVKVVLMILLKGINWILQEKFHP